MPVLHPRAKVMARMRAVRVVSPMVETIGAYTRSHESQTTASSCSSHLSRGGVVVQHRAPWSRRLRANSAERSSLCSVTLQRYLVAVPPRNTARDRVANTAPRLRDRTLPTAYAGQP